jgi:hypothetical protein
MTVDVTPNHRYYQSIATPVTVISKQLCPDEVVTLALSHPIGEFTAAYGDANFLLVKLDDPTGELEAGLAAQQTSQSRAGSNLNVLGFHTVVADLHDAPRGAAKDDLSGVGVAELRRRLTQARHFAITLEKRVHDGSYQDRVSVGRARNKDVVLRHPSVSKFHAWFERDAQGIWSVADAGSKNGTRANTTDVAVRELAKIKPGDVLRFGSVEVMLCSADSLWKTLRVS